jgi:hypothetical protein
MALAIDLLRLKAHVKNCALSTVEGGMRTLESRHYCVSATYTTSWLDYPLARSDNDDLLRCFTRFTVHQTDE